MLGEIRWSAPEAPVADIDESFEERLQVGPLWDRQVAQRAAVGIVGDPVGREGSPADHRPRHVAAVATDPPYPGGRVLGRRSGVGGHLQALALVFDLHDQRRAAAICEGGVEGQRLGGEEVPDRIGRQVDALPQGILKEDVDIRDAAAVGVRVDVGEDSPGCRPLKSRRIAEGARGRNIGGAVAGYDGGGGRVASDAIDPRQHGGPSTGSVIRMPVMPMFLANSKSVTRSPMT